MRSGFAVIALALVACRTPAATAVPAAVGVAGGAVAVMPLQLGDAHRADRALILGTGDGDGATVVPLAIGEQRVTVDAIVLTTAPRGDDDDGGLVAMASVVAADVLGKDPTALRFAASDAAPASSALLTAGFVAALLGRSIAAEVTLTGAIHPDGTIGPVDGLPQQLAAAIDRGKRRVGYPIGMRHAIDATTGQPVDLMALAQARGAEAIEIADVYDAVALLTGEPLPRPRPVDVAAMALPPEVDAALAAQYAHWQGLLAAAWPRVLTLSTSRAVPKAIAQLARDAERDLAAAEQARTDGRGAVALRLLTRAWLAAATATATIDVIDRVKAGDLAGAQTRLAALEALAATSDADLAAIGAAEPVTMGGHLQRVAAFQLAIAGWGFRAQAATQHLPAARAMLAALASATPAVLASAATIEQVTTTTLPAVAAIARSVVAHGDATTALAIEATASIDYRGAGPNLRRIATALQAAAGSNLADATGPGRPAELRATWGEASISWTLFTLAASALAYHRTATPVSEQDAPLALAAQLTGAERRAREHARAARVATGSIPVQARLHYQLAQAQRGGDVADQREALASYRTASQCSQLAVMLARNPR